MKKLGIHLGRVLLVVGTGLSVFVAIEAHQKMVDATTLSPSNAYVQGGGGAFNPQIPVAATGSSQSTNRQGSATGNTSRATARPSIAINTSSPGDRPQKVAQVNPSQFSYNEWAGASFPVENFQAYTSPFGYRQSATGGYSQEFHYGLDMAAPQGSYIRSWWTGKVVEVSDDSNCGTSVVVEAGQWISIYCHMEGNVESANGRRYMIDREGGLQIFEGQEVSAGQRVGRVGMTGRTTGPHLHWGMKYDENWVDPALVLRAMYGSQSVSAVPRTTNPNATDSAQ